MGELLTVRRTLWVNEPAGIEIRGGVVFWEMPPGTDYDVCSTPAVLLESIRRSTMVYERFAHGDDKVASIARGARARH